MRRRGVLALLALAPPALALTPCSPGTRPGVIAEIRFGLLLPDGDDVTQAQWRTFRADILDPVLRTDVRERDEPPTAGPPPQRVRVVHAEVRMAFDPSAPEAFPPDLRTVIGAWRARFPAAPIEAKLLPVCLGR